jgi:hypothetical protein
MAWNETREQLQIEGSSLGLVRCAILSFTEEPWENHEKIIQDNRYLARILSWYHPKAYQT